MQIRQISGLEHYYAILWHFNIENAIAVIRDEKTITNKHGKELGAIVHLHVTNTRETCRRFY